MKKILLFAMVLSTVAYSCKKDKHKGCTDPLSIRYDTEAEEDDNSCIYGGLGGNVTLVASPEHHGVPIVSDSTYVDSLFIKFNAIDSPGSNPSNYDVAVAGEPGEDHVHYHGLKPGRYYIMMTGWDSTGNERVSGGLRITISQEQGEFEAVVPVTE
jgi:hypothetical protein